MTRDVRLAVFDVAVTLGFIALAIFSGWWWAVCAMGGASIAYRQMRLSIRASRVRT